MFMFVEWRVFDLLVLLLIQNDTTEGRRQLDGVVVLDKKIKLLFASPAG